MKTNDLKAKDIMKTDVIKAYGSMTLTELAALFETEHITGAPVIEGSEKLIGVVSETDFVKERALHTDDHKAKQTVHPYFKDSGNGIVNSESEEEVESFVQGSDERTVEEIMTPWTISVSENAPVVEIASIMVKHHIHRVLVTDKQFHLKGIITTMDLVRLMANGYGHKSESSCCNVTGRS